MPLGSNDNKQYGAQDFERYYSGQMSAQEMHALEKAALDDPFLADALEGYKATRTPVADIAWLKSQLEEKTRRAGVVPIARGKSLAFLRIAALILLVLGAGWSVYYLMDSKKDTLALDTQKEKEAMVQKATATVPAPDTASKEVVPLQQEAVPLQQSSTATLSGNTAAKTSIKPESTPSAAAAPPVANMEADDAPKSLLRQNDLSNDIAAVEPKQTMPPGALEGRVAGVTLRRAGTVNSFQGRVVDANNRGVPGASVTIRNNKTAVATDEEGYFSLSTPDTVVNANVAAVGYEPKNVTFNKGKEETNIVLKESGQNLSEVVVVGYGVKKRKSATGAAASTALPQPAKGWAHFQNYLKQNQKPAKELFAEGLTGSVTLSFDVNRKGTPINIKVDSSLSPRYDDEAIRLLRKGPKWERGKNTRGKVIISFQ
jgi:TonB family protein